MWFLTAVCVTGPCSRCLVWRIPFWSPFYDQPKVFICHCTFLTSFNEHNCTFVLWEQVGWFMPHECHMFLYSRYTLLSPLSKNTTVQLKDSTCKVMPREGEPHNINFWAVSHGTNKATMRFCCIFWNWPHLPAFVIEHCAPDCNREWLLQCTMAVC